MKFLSVFLGLLMILSATLSYHLYHGNIPSSYIPWKPIDLQSPPGLFTKYKLGKLQDDFDSCQTALETADIEFTVIGDRDSGNCPLTNQISIQKSLYPYSAPVRSQCALAAAVVFWENQIVQPLAEEFFASDVARIDHYGIFSCRNIRGSQTRLSQHATANAIDIAAIRLKDGTVISVLNDWNNEDEKGRFLRELHLQSCSVFKGALGPEYNDLHRDHFHFDLGRWNICR